MTLARARHSARGCLAFAAAAVLSALASLVGGTSEKVPSREILCLSGQGTPAFLLAAPAPTRYIIHSVVTAIPHPPGVSIGQRVGALEVTLYAYTGQPQTGWGKHVTVVQCSGYGTRHFKNS